jgi:hypothetical protein
MHTNFILVCHKVSFVIDGKSLTNKLENLDIVVFFYYLFGYVYVVPLLESPGCIWLIFHEV